MFQRSELELTKEDIINQLPLGKRLGLKLLLPLAHSSTANREASKSLLIRLVPRHVLSSLQSPV